MYTETQKFRQPLIWALLVGCLTLYRWQAVGVGIMTGVLILFWFLLIGTQQPEQVRKLAEKDYTPNR
ncbi:hypothetical protein [Larkinella terrae]|uniref:Uncharacterized protein n=1 Tax=Larkinella terrae TaxID=2025311 RepID=A0A7K0ENY4_9BACT|nr:hypothetical protein [Larkinella terrae]MRS63499.1 hypothetical protein [Larkinella terrae]